MTKGSTPFGECFFIHISEPCKTIRAVRRQFPGMNGHARRVSMVGCQGNIKDIAANASEKIGPFPGRLSFFLH